MKSAGKIAEVKSGLRLAGMVLLGGAWLGLVFGGMGIAFTPSPHPPLIGWLLLVVAALIFVTTMDRWVKAFPGILGWGIVGGILTIAGGHALNHPEVPVRRLDATIMTLLIAASAIVSNTFNRKLRILDRIAVFSFAFCFFWEAVDDRFKLTPLGIGFGSLLAAWAFDFIQRWRRGKRRPSRMMTPL
jgi:hypothetical protein